MIFGFMIFSCLNSLLPEHGAISVPEGSGGTNVTFTDAAVKM